MLSTIEAGHWWIAIIHNGTARVFMLYTYLLNTSVGIRTEV